MNLYINGKNFYEILKVPEDATQSEIRKAYIKLAKKYHPDVTKDGESCQKFLDICTAYDTLSDIEKRKAYDKILFKDAEDFDYGEDNGKIVPTKKQSSEIATKHNNTDIDKKTESKPKSKLTVYPKAKSLLDKHKYKLIIGGLVAAALFVGYRIGEATKPDVEGYSISSADDNDREQNPISKRKNLTAENIDEKVQEILTDNQTKGLNIDPTFIKSALFITNIDYLDQEDIKTLYDGTELNMIEEIQNMYNYTSAVGTHNNNVALGQEDGQYISLATLAYDEQDKAILEELNTEFIDLANELKNKTMTSEEFQESFKYITEFYTGNDYLTTNSEQYSNYSLTAGGGLLSEQYWPMFSVVYSNSEYLTAENKVDIKTLSYGTDGTDAVINGSKYLGAIINHESLNCLDNTQEMTTEKTLTKTQ